MITLFKPHLSKIPYLQVPENRVALAYNWYAREPKHENNFPALSYWLERCSNDDSNY
jgi:hypothetical protein